ncbi:MAG TPA: NfeD family protein [Acidimicrobiia bacterium]|nr:NfeD family protein [Acidimicrobiia bacterium]
MALLRRLLVPLAFLLAWSIPWAGAQGAAPPVDVVEVSGPVDRTLVDYVVGVIEDTDAQLVVLSVNAPAAIDEDVRELMDLIADPPVPVAVWVGPAPAIARGGAAQLLLAAPIKGAAPDVRIGDLLPTVAGSGDDGSAVRERFPEAPEEIYGGVLTVGVEPIPGLVDVVSPSIGQLVVGLHGTPVAVRGETVVLDTAATEVDEEGTEVTVPAAEVRFSKPGVLTRTLRVAVHPEAAFFFLLAGLALVAFEFYSAGPGVAAAAGMLSLLVAGYGMAVLPVRWWAVALALGGTLLYTVEFQRNDLGWKSLLGTGALIASGLWFIDGSGQLTPVWWGVLLAVATVAFFFGVALTTVVRARFSTVTIGREGFVGRTGTAVSAFDPDGVVDVDGARWRASSYRAAGIAPGDAVTVVAVEGITLEVAPIDPE